MSLCFGSSWIRCTANKAMGRILHKAARSARPSSPYPLVIIEWEDSARPISAWQCQPAMAIYHNQKGHLVIRQERSWAEETDPYVMISPENAVAFMEALAKRARE